MTDPLAWFDSEVQKLAERLGDAYERPTATAIVAARRVLVWAVRTVGHEPTKIVPFDAGGLAVEFTAAPEADFASLSVDADGSTELLTFQDCRLVSRRGVVWASGLGWRTTERKPRPDEGRPWRPPPLEDPPF